MKIGGGRVESGPPQRRLGPDDPMPFGKHAGQRMSDVPDDYFEWLYYEEDLEPGPVRDYIEEFVV